LPAGDIHDVAATPAFSYCSGMKVTVAEAAARLPELIAAAQAGVEVIIANDAGPGVRLALVEKPDHAPGSWAAIKAALDALPPRPARSAEDIERDVKEIRDGWD
jgi:antitoxin (DNA-binding transcriptional repressor) of toxin-antitoxin stability system